MLHSLLLLAVVISLAPLAKYIPHAALAGILIKVGYDIIDIAYLKRAHRGPRLDLVLMALVLLLTVFVDLITAVAVGVVLASLAFVKQLADEQLEKFANEDNMQVATSPEERSLIEEAGHAVNIFEFGGPLSFGAAADLGHHVRERTRHRAAALILDFTDVPFMDVSAARAVETIICDAKQAGKTVYISGLDDEVAETLAALDATHCLPSDTSYKTRIEALRAAVEYVRLQRDKKGAGGGAAVAGTA